MTESPVPVTLVEPGQEDNLLLQDCQRCQEPRYHLCELVASYPLCLHWLLTCGECGCQVQGWEDIGTMRWWAGGEEPEPD